MTRQPGAQVRTSCRFERRAPLSTRARITRIMARKAAPREAGYASMPRCRRRSVASTQHPLRVGIGGEVHEARVLPLEGEQESTDLAVAMLRQIDLGDAFLGGVPVIDLVAIDQQDHVRILLNSSAFA